jgi:hypothetical protein
MEPCTSNLLVEALFQQTLLVEPHHLTRHGLSIKVDHDYHKLGFSTTSATQGASSEGGHMRHSWRRRSHDNGHVMRGWLQRQWWSHEARAVRVSGLHSGKDWLRAPAATRGAAGFGGRASSSHDLLQSDTSRASSGDDLL